MVFFVLTTGRRPGIRSQSGLLCNPPKSDRIPNEYSNGVLFAAARLNGQPFCLPILAMIRPAILPVILQASSAAI